MIFLPHPDFKLPPMRRGECSAALLWPTLRIRTAADWLRPPAQSPPTWPSAIDYRSPLRQRLRRQLSDRGRPAGRGTDLLPGGHHETGQLPPVCDRFQGRPTAPYSALLFYCAVKKTSLLSIFQCREGGFAFLQRALRFDPVEYDLLAGLEERGFSDGGDKLAFAFVIANPIFVLVLRIKNAGGFL